MICLITLREESCIISKNSNITDNIIWWSLTYSTKRGQPTMNLSGIPVLAGYSYEEFSSRTKQNRPLLRKEEKKPKEITLGPRRNLINHFTICHWNLNSIYVHNFAKVQLLKAYLPVHKFDIVCLSETYLNSCFPFDGDNLDIPGYVMIRADHPANSKRGGVCMYYKNCLPLKVLDIRFLHKA